MLVINCCSLFSLGLSNAASGEFGWGRDSSVGVAQSSKEDVVV